MKYVNPSREFSFQYCIDYPMKGCDELICIKPVIYVIDSDRDMKNSLTKSMENINLAVKGFDCAEDFLSLKLESLVGCVITEVELPGLNGFQNAAIIKERNPDLAIIFHTCQGSIANSVKAIKNGAFNFLSKSYDHSKLKEQVRDAIAFSSLSKKKSLERRALRQRHEGLTPREKEVLHLVTSGFMNKQIAAELGISEITVKIHRRKVMDKMQVHSLADLVRAAERLGIESAYHNINTQDGSHAYSC